MKGLIKKDLLVLKHNFKTFILAAIIFVACGMNSEGIESFLIPFMVAMLCISSFNYDEFNKWDAYAITLPMGRENVVKAKYGLVLIMLIASTFLSFATSLFLGTLKNSIDYANIIELTLGGMIAGLLIITIMFPLIFKWGVEKGRIGIMILSFGTASLIMILANIFKIRLGSLQFLENSIGIILPFIILAFLIVSYCLSKRIYSNKEF